MKVLFWRYVITYKVPRFFSQTHGCVTLLLNSCGTTDNWMSYQAVGFWNIWVSWAFFSSTCPLFSPLFVLQRGCKTKLSCTVIRSGVYNSGFFRFFFSLILNPSYFLYLLRFSVHWFFFFPSFSFTSNGICISPRRGARASESQNLSVQYLIEWRRKKK